MYSENLRHLGQIHWYLVNSSNLMAQKRADPIKTGIVTKYRLTTLGEEVENNEINWWVFKREKNIIELELRTKTALQAAGQLKYLSEKISKYSYKSLDQLRMTYEKFANEQAINITTILDYVTWLFQKDELAPTILFNYRTWGSTRMADRSAEVDISEPNDLEKIDQLTSVVLGYSKRGRQVVDLVRSEMEYEWFENIDFDPTADQEFKLPDEDFERRAAYEVSKEFAEYFEQLRDSLRNILLDIDQRESEERLFTSDEFWRNFIIKAKDSPKTEQNLWDFKKILDMWNVKKEPSKSEVENKFAQLVAGFANSEGGVIIVGVTDIFPRQVVGIGTDLTTVERNMQYTKEVINEYIKYDSEFVHLQQVSVPDTNSDLQLCLVIAVRQTYQSVGVKSIDGKSYSYPVREETGLTWEEPGSLALKKHFIAKSDNYNFLRVLKQFVKESL